MYFMCMNFINYEKQEADLKKSVHFLQAIFLINNRNLITFWRHFNQFCDTMLSSEFS